MRKIDNCFLENPGNKPKTTHKQVKFTKQLSNFYLCFNQINIFSFVFQKHFTLKNIKIIYFFDICNSTTG